MDTIYWIVLKGNRVLSTGYLTNNGMFSKHLSDFYLEHFSTLQHRRDQILVVRSFSRTTRQGYPFYES